MLGKSEDSRFRCSSTEDLTGRLDTEHEKRLEEEGKADELEGELGGARGPGQGHRSDLA